VELDPGRRIIICSSIIFSLKHLLERDVSSVVVCRLEVTTRVVPHELVVEVHNSWSYRAAVAGSPRKIVFFDRFAEMKGAGNDPRIYFVERLFTEIYTGSKLFAKKGLSPLPTLTIRDSRTLLGLLCIEGTLTHVCRWVW